MFEKGGLQETFCRRGKGLIFNRGLEIFQKTERAWQERGGEKIEESRVATLKEFMFLFLQFGKSRSRVV